MAQAVATAGGPGQEKKKKSIKERKRAGGMGDEEKQEGREAELRKIEPEMFTLILSGHKRWVESNETEGIRANFQRAYLADRRFGGANLKRANLRGAYLVNADFTDTDLGDADLTGSVLIRAHLTRASLFGTKFTGADLREAVLTEAYLLDINQLAGADLSGTKLPKDIAKFEILDNVTDGTRRAVKLFITYILTILYLLSVVALVGFGVEDFVVRQGKVLLPLGVGIQISIIKFWHLAPLGLLLFWGYFQIYMQRLWEHLALLPAIFQDGVPLDKKAAPWLLLGYIRSHVKLVRKDEKSQLELDRSAVTRLQNWIIVGLLWCLAPATIGAFWYLYPSVIGRHPEQFLGQSLLFFAATVTAVSFYALAGQTLRREASEKASLVDLAWFLLGVVPFFAALTYFRWPG